MQQTITLFLLLFGSALAAQLPQYFTGLARTQVPYLTVNSNGLRAGSTADVPLLHLRPRQNLTVALTELQQELVNLPTITNADWQIDSVAGKPTGVTWRIEESRTVFPLLNIGGVRGNFHYLLGLSDLHFRGRGQQLTAFYQNNDGEHNYYLGLNNRSYKGSRWGYEVESRRYAAIEPIFFSTATVDYRYSNLSFSAGPTYRTPNRHLFRLILSNFYERYRKLNPELTTPGPDDVTLQKGLLKLGHERNHLDYFSERLSGNYHWTVAQWVHDFSNNSDFFIAIHELRGYWLVGQRGNLAARLRVGLSSNEPSPFAPFVLDSQVNIRGSGNRIDRGTAQLVFNLEYRHRLWRDRKQRFAGQVVAFSDLGTWRNPGGSLEDLADVDNVRHFVGLGLRAISLKAFNALLRLDYGMDVRNPRERGFVAGFGQYF